MINQDIGFFKQKKENCKFKIRQLPNSAATSLAGLMTTLIHVI
jgi:hypothetical protein